jgi:hypothetical protein
MSYVFDNGPFSQLFRNYYRRPFRSLWERFNALIEDGSIVSAREVLREIEDGPEGSLLDWATAHRDLFAMPTAREGEFIARIYAVPHFQQNIERQKLLRGGRHADSFVIAKAAIEGRTVVTTEQLRPNAVKIPNICQHFQVPCLSLEGFMDAEEWEF